jgi:acyl-homoserine-lactone acylase
VDDPVHTPNTLRTSDPRVALALGDAIADLDGAGIPYDAPLGDWQYVTRDGERIPIHGGPGSVGVFNAINVSWQGDPDGFPDRLRRRPPRHLVPDGVTWSATPTATAPSTPPRS